MKHYMSISHMAIFVYMATQQLEVRIIHQNYIINFFPAASSLFSRWYDRK